MASGRPDWYGSMTMHGKYGDEYISVALNSLGHMIAEMMGWDGVDLQRIAVDGDGVMKANLWLQELPFMTVRPAYGSAVRDAGSMDIPSGVETELFAVTDQGVLSSGMFWVSEAASRKNMAIRIKVDDVLVFDNQYLDLYHHRNFDTSGFLMGLSRYDDQNFEYVMMLQRNLTFETNIKVYCYHTYGVGVLLNWKCIYALTP